MLVDFKLLPNNARVWVFQASRKLSESEVEILKPRTEVFLSQWTAHGQNLEAGFEVRYNRFIVLGLNQDNASASGCSIDASVKFIQSLEKDFEFKFNS